MFSFKKDYAGPSSLMYLNPLNKKNCIIRTKRRIPKSLYLDHEEIKKPVELVSSISDINAIQNFWDKHNETSEFKINNTNFDILKMFQKKGKCIALYDCNSILYATLFSYELEEPVYINGSMQNVRYIDGAVINHKYHASILHWLFSWMEYLYSDIYMFTSDTVPLKVCSIYSTNKYHAISSKFIKQDDVGLAERITDITYVNNIQYKVLQKYKSEINLIYKQNFDSMYIDLYKVPMQIHKDHNYIIAVKNINKTYKKYNIPVHEVIFCCIVNNDKSIVINPGEDERYMTRYAIESVCKTGNYELLLLNNKEMCGDIYIYDEPWNKIKIESKNLYLYNYTTHRFYEPNVYFPI